MTSAGRLAGLRAGTVADSMTQGCSVRQARSANLPDPCTFLRLLLRLDGLVEHELAALDEVAAVERQRRVAIIVDLVGTEDALRLLGVEERLDGLGAVAAALGDGVERRGHGLVAVDG